MLVEAMEKYLVNVEDIGNGRARLTHMLASYRQIPTATGVVRSFEPGRVAQTIVAHRGEIDLARWQRQCAMDRAKVGL